jgi:hypothetical protein
MVRIMTTGSIPGQVEVKPLPEMYYVFLEWEGRR